MKTIHQFLLCSTPDAWIKEAVKHQELLLIDHANCERKAASTAMTLMHRYVDDFELLNKMSRLAREELRHFEQVIAIMKARHIDYVQITPSRYASELRKPMRTFEPARLIDTLVVGAIIEARSCERFEKLAPHLDPELEGFYVSLLKSESRHYQDYLNLAKEAAGETEINDRIRLFLSRDKNLVEASDTEFRFHSGVPEEK
ncbi:MAG: tRNA-(ms[2]io[6]A)-hydroxylase [Lentisphaeria bacterium]|jgi:tRNA-(ms[2]io[6]A)-hydroxylase